MNQNNMYAPLSQILQQDFYRKMQSDEQKRYLSDLINSFQSPNFVNAALGAIGNSKGKSGALFDDGYERSQIMY